MKKSLMLFVLIAIATATCLAGSKPQSGTILSHTSVACGEKRSKKQSLHLMCHQYVVRSGGTDFTVQQPKPEDQTLIPLNTQVEFKLDKSKMKLKANGESYEFVVVSQAAAGSTPAAPASSSPTR